MKVLINCLTFGNRPLNIIEDNLMRKGFDCDINYVNVEGIANALNEGIKDYNNYDAIGFLANDIIEPNDWLLKKLTALNTYEKAGIVASSLDCERITIQNELIISNWLISTKLIEAIGKFNEQFYPYGAIDLDYCERTYIAGFQTYYVINCLATHNGSHATGNEYGWDKSELVSRYAVQYNENINQYKNGSKSIKL